MFTENANQIFRKSIADYHRYDDVDRAIENPYAEGSIEHLLYMKTGSIRCSGIWRTSSAIRRSTPARR